MKRKLIPFNSFQRRTSGPPYFTLQSNILFKKPTLQFNPVQPPDYFPRC